MRQAHYDSDQTRWHTCNGSQPCSSFSPARNENTFVLLCSSMCKSKCQIHHITGRWEITANEIQRAHSERALVGACESSRGHMERWIRLISDRHAGEGIEAYVNTDSVFSLVLRLQLPFMTSCQCEHAKQCPMEHLMLFQNTDYFNGKLGNKLLNLAIL